MERFDPSVKFHTWYEHWHRYHFIKDLVKGKRVGDIACGEGYGSALLASYADSVIGVDIDSNVISNAKEKYKNKSNLSYIQSNALKTSFDDNSFDVIVSFETLEHLSEQDQLLNEFKRLLSDDGLLIISTPDKDVYSEIDEGHNQFHVKELTQTEFNYIISSKFNFNKTYGQQFQLMSVIENIKSIENKDDLASEPSIYVEEDNEFEASLNKSPAKYLIKFCSDKEQIIKSLKLPKSHCFSDDKNSLFKHYEEQIDRLMLLDKHQLKLKNTIEQQNAIINHLKARLGL
jgi:ubiquinone/menaquinone biosynthesis C-methylase UbiE